MIPTEVVRALMEVPGGTSLGQLVWVEVEKASRGF